MISVATLCVVITVIQLSKSEVTAKYLNGGSRLSNASFFDYYFCCHAEGVRLRLAINEESLTLFQGTEAGRVDVGFQQTFNYSATLVSVTSTLEGRFGFDLIVVVSVSSARSIEVECRSGMDINTTSNNEKPLSSGITSNSSSRVMMQQLFSGRIVQPSSGNMTYGFICGVQRTSQFWLVENRQIAFSILDNIGEAQPTRPSSATSPFTFYQLGFLSARAPYELVSILFVTGDMDVTVICGAGLSTAQLLTTNLNRAQLLTTDLNHLDHTSIGRNEIEDMSTSTFLSTSEPTESIILVHSSIPKDSIFKENMDSQAWRNEPTSATAGLLLAVGLLLKQLYC